MIIGSIIKDLREHYGYTQKELSKMLGISSGCLSKYETGKTIPAPDILIKMSIIFNVPVDYIIGKNNIKFDYKLISEDFINNYSCIDLLNDSLSLDPKHRKQLVEYIALLKFRSDFSKISGNKL